jgi:cell wall-associated NlpC family hydrolase
MDPASALRLTQLAVRARERINRRRIAAGLAAAAAVVALIVFGSINALLGGGQDELTGGNGTGSCVSVNADVASADLDAGQIGNAASIVATGQRLGVPRQGWIIGIATAMQESKLDNTLTPAQSDRDSAGMFQQRAAWGPLSVRMDPTGSSEMFYSGGRAGQRGLLDISGWQLMSMTAAAQAVQVSAFPDAYAQWERLAISTVAALTAEADPGNPAPAGFDRAVRSCGTRAAPASWTALAGRTDGENAVNAAARWIGTPYSWGGGTRTGPSEGFAQGAGTVGFDCSGLVLYSWWQAAQVELPHSAASIASSTTPVPREQIQAGDILSFATEGGGVSHDGLADGRGGMVHAPSTGKNIAYVPGVLSNRYYATRLVSITRPSVGGAAR